MGDRRGNRLGPMATLGAWLGLWTPPRAAVVPPVPWRAIAAAAVALAAVVVAGVLVLAPRVAEDREAARERDRRAEARRRAEFLATVDREQRPRHGRGRRDPADRAAPARIAAREALLASAESGIELDARRRTGRRIRGVDCEPFPRGTRETAPAEQLSRPAAAYGCVAVTARFDAGTEGIIGIPFRLVVRFDRGRFSWCRIVPLGDRDRLSHRLPSACRL